MVHINLGGHDIQWLKMSFLMNLKLGLYKDNE